MNILLTNDDSIYAEGIYALYRALKKTGKVTVVAPDAEQSAVGHGITMASPLRVRMARRKGRPFGHAVSGTPADCVKIAVRSLLKRKPDIVISGINLGPNTGFSVLYSGTVSGAAEGAILGIPSIAVSLGTYSEPDYTLAASFTAKLAARLHNHGLPKGVFLNVNVPSVPRGKVKGYKVVKHDKTPILEQFEKRVDPRKRHYYWLTGEVVTGKGEPNSDSLALHQGYITVTPLKYDLTDYESLHTVQKWNI